MSRYFRITIGLVVAVVVIQMFAVGLSYGRGRCVQPTTLGYSDEQIEGVRKGNHAWSDSLVTRGLAFYYTTSKDSGYKQVKMIQSVDTGYWLGYHTEGYMRAMDGDFEGCIELMSKSLELNVDGERFVNYAGDTLTEAQAWLYIAEGYLRRGDEYSRHFARDCVEAAMEERSGACWQDRREAEELMKVLEGQTNRISEARRCIAENATRWSRFLLVSLVTIKK